jgi:hypothetical protein
MDLAAFKSSLGQSQPPSGISLALQGLWWDAKGDWNKAHDCAQRHEDMAGNWLHAYLHRKEGDLGNAGYWYRRAGKPTGHGSLELEWEMIVSALLAES